MRVGSQRDPGSPMAGWSLFLIVLLWSAVIHVIFGSGDEFSERLVRGSLERYARQGDADLGGFMLAFDERVHVAAVHAIAPEMSSRAEVGYVSQFGLPYDLEKRLVALAGGVARGILVSQLLLAAAFSVCLVLLAAAVRREFGNAEAAVVLLCYLSSRVMLFTSHLYWATALLIAPFCVMWFWYPALRGRSRAAVLGVAFGLMFLRALCGYEFITTIILAMAIPIVFYEARDYWAAASPDWRPHAARIALPAIAGVVGVLAAMSLHIAKAAFYFGTFSQGLAAIIVPLTYSSVAGDQFRGPLTLGSVVWAILVYLAQTIYFPGYNLATALVVIVCVLAAVGRVRAVAPADHLGRRGAQERALGLAALLSIAAPLSWWLMLKHNVVHTHINWMLYALFMVPMLALLASHRAARTARGLLTLRRTRADAEILPGRRETRHETA